MADRGGDSEPVRRLVLKAMASVGASIGTSGCLGNSDGDSKQDGEETSTDRVQSTGSVENEAASGDETSLEIDGELFEAGPSVELEQLTEWLGVTTDVEFYGREEDNLFVTTKGGKLYVVDRDSRSPPESGRATVLLDLTDEVVLEGDSGLLGIDFHPEFDRNRRFFLRYSAPPSPGEPTPYGYDGHVERLSEFRMSDDLTVDQDSERILLSIPQIGPKHNSGDVLFGPDGFLYVTTGEGGFWDDDNWGREGPSQKKENLLGSVLRIDVDSTGEDRLYGIPPDNPLVDEEGYRDELYAWGFRNPWGASFDGDDLYVADVGDFAFESVYRVEKGGNYGWAVTEGVCVSRYFSSEYPPDHGCPPEASTNTVDDEPFQDPVIGYPHEYEDRKIGSAVMGGGVYRGRDIPELQGTYVFGDWKTPITSKNGEASGALFVAVHPDTVESVRPYYRDHDLWPIRPLDYDHSSLLKISCIGFDSQGEIYVLDGRVHRVRPARERE